MWKIALRPRWIAALLLALAVAAGFAGLSQWQLSRSVSTGIVVDRPTETIVPLTDVAAPQVPLLAPAEGQLVTVSGTYTATDTVVLSERYNGGERGYWVVVHLTAEGAGVAVALGWTASEETASSVASGFDKGDATVSGRLVGDEGPQTGDFESGELSTLSMAAMVNLWSVVDDNGVYNGYIIDGTPAAGLEKIDSPTPSQEVELNWLNLFYAAEWVIFAGFAVFLWWRLVRDVWEREQTQESVD